MAYPYDPGQPPPTIPGGSVTGGPPVPPVNSGLTDPLRQPFKQGPTLNQTGGPCPPGQSPHPTRGDCRYAGDYPCPPGQCKDVASGVCRSPGGHEKLNETDITQRDTGGGRGYCKQLESNQPGRGGMYGQGGGGGGAAGAGGGGGLGASPGGGLGAPAGLSGVSGTIWDTLNGVLKGGQTRFTPEVMATLAGQAKSLEQGQIKTGTDAVTSDAIRRGIYRSPAVNPDVANVVRGAQGNYSQTIAQQQVAKVSADFQDKMGALDRAQKFLDSARDYLLRSDMNAIDRERIRAQLALGYANIASQQQMLTQQLTQQQQQWLTGLLSGLA